MPALFTSAVVVAVGVLTHRPGGQMRALSGSRWARTPEILPEQDSVWEETPPPFLFPLMPLDSPDWEVLVKCQVYQEFSFPSPSPHRSFLVLPLPCQGLDRI